MNSRPERTLNSQSPVPPPPVPRSTAPSPSRNVPERKTESTPSFTQRRRMERGNDEQRWKRTDLHLIHYMTKLKDEYIQRQTDHDEQTRKLTTSDLDELVQDDIVMDKQTQQPSFENLNGRLPDAFNKASHASRKELAKSNTSLTNQPKSMIPVRSPTNLKRSSVAGVAEDEGTTAKKNITPVPRTARGNIVRRAVSNIGGTSAYKDYGLQELRANRSEGPGQEHNNTLDASGVATDHVFASLNEQMALENDHTATQENASNFNAHLDKSKQSHSGMPKLTDKVPAKNEFRQLTSANKNTVSNERVTAKKSLQNAIPSKLKFKTTKASATELRVDGSDNPMEGTSRSKRTKSGSNPTVVRSRWSGLVLEDAKPPLKRNDISVSPMMLHSVKKSLSKDDKLPPKRKSSLPNTKVTQRLSPKQRREITAERKPSPQVPISKLYEKVSSESRNLKADIRQDDSKRFQNRRSFSPQPRSSLQLVPLSHAEMSNDSDFEGSDEKAGSVQGTPSVIIHSTRRTIISDPPAKKATSYKMESPPSSAKSRSSRLVKKQEKSFKSNASKTKSIRSRSPVRKESQVSKQRGEKNKRRKRKAKDLRVSSSNSASPSVGFLKNVSMLQLDILHEQSTPDRSVTRGSNFAKTRKKDTHSAAILKEVKKKKKPSAEHSKHSEFSPKKKEKHKRGKKLSSTEDRYTQVGGADIAEEKKKRSLSQSKINLDKNETKPEKTFAHKAVGSIRHRTKRRPCHCSSGKIHKHKRKRCQRKPHYKYILDPLLYAYFNEKQRRKVSKHKRRKYLWSSSESCQRLDTSLTSFTSLQSLTETSLTRSEYSACQSSVEHSVSGFINKGSNKLTCQCLSVRDSNTLSWNMSESNVQVHSFQKTSSPKKKSAKNKAQRTNQQDTASERAFPKTSLLAKEIRRKCRIPVSISSNSHSNPVKRDQPSEGVMVKTTFTANKPLTIVAEVPDSETENEDESRELETVEAEVERVLANLCQSQQELEMKFEIVLESFNLLKANRKLVLEHQSQTAEKQRELAVNATPQFEATYFDYFMFVAFLAVQIIFQVVFIKKF
ncbi:hypothetical protein BgiMline_034379 [Biomphalaria glabrata]